MRTNWHEIYKTNETKREFKNILIILLDITIYAQKPYTKH